MTFFKSNFEKVKEYLEELKTRDIKHTQGKSLLEHFLRVHSIVERWGFDDITQTASLCHSLYSTEYFAVKVLDINCRSILQKKIGVEAERLVYYFSLMKRDSLIFLEKESNYEIENIYTQEKYRITKKEGDSLLHIMLANDIDHLTIENLGQSTSLYKKYQNTYGCLYPLAKEELDRVVSFSNNKLTQSARVRFIAHAGVMMTSSGVTIAIDPWLYDSRRDAPIIEGLDPVQRTIDYLIPESKTSAQDISPDIVFLSHFHTHHSPLREIIEFVKIKPITVICPVLEKSKLNALRQKVGDYIFSRITFRFLEEDEDFIVQPFQVQVFRNQDEMPHFMYFIKSKDTSIMHIVDAKANKDNNRKDFDSTWDRVKGLNPDYLFVGCVGHILKNLKNGERGLTEQATLSPAQAASLAVLVQAKTVVPIGMYNHSVWDDRYEMGLSVGDAEAQMYWALSHIAPAIVFRKAYPGDFLC